MLLALWSYFGDDIYQKMLLGYTKMEKDNIIYRADINYRGLGCWYDNVMVDWDSSNYLIPAELKLFFCFESKQQMFAIVHSCHTKFKSLSVLSSLWIKEYENDTTKRVRTLEPYNNEEDDCSKREPILRVILCKAIHSHCLVVPVKVCSQQVLHIKDTFEWADEFFTID